jgi:hypothetical protein
MRVELDEGCSPEPSVWSMAVLLDDDRPGCGCGSGGECCGQDPTEDSALPTLSVRERQLQEYDFTGTPQWGWITRVEGPAIQYTERRERNDATGQTMVTASAVLAWDSDTDGAAPAESAVIWDSGAKRWEITSCTALPGRLEIRMERVDDAA